MDLPAAARGGIERYALPRRDLVYTAVTRGKRLVVIVGQPKALAIAVKGDRTRRRWSKLGAWLGGEKEPARSHAAEVPPAYTGFQR